MPIAELFFQDASTKVSTAIAYSIHSSALLYLRNLLERNKWRRSPSRQKGGHLPLNDRTDRYAIQFLVSLQPQLGGTHGLVACYQSYLRNECRPRHAWTSQHSQIQGDLPCKCPHCLFRLKILPLPPHTEKFHLNLCVGPGGISKQLHNSCVNSHFHIGILDIRSCALKISINSLQPANVVV